MLSWIVYLERLRNKRQYQALQKFVAVGATLGIMIGVISFSYRAANKNFDNSSKAGTSDITKVFRATEDTYVDSKKANNNFGTSKSLISWGSPENISYYKFDLGSVPADQLILGATLSIYSSSTSSSGLKAALVDSPWSETTAKYSNKPAYSTTVSVPADSLINNSWITFNVSQIVAPRLGNTISFAVLSSKNKVTFASSETATIPQLILQFPSTSPVSTVTPTTTVDPTITTEPTATITPTDSPIPTPTQPPVSSTEQCNPVNKTANNLTELKTLIEQSKPGDHIQLLTSATGTFSATFPGVATDTFRCLSYADGVQTNGLFRAAHPTRWIFQNLKATWGTGTASDHMFRITGGTGWILRNSEIWGAQSFANLHITGTATKYKVVNNYIHNVADIIAVNTEVQNHNIYISDADDGIIAGNRITNAPRGRCIKVANSSSTSTSNPDRNIVKFNTFRNCTGPSLVGVSYGATGNEFHHNIFDSGPCVMNVQSITGAGNTMYNNVYWNITNDCMTTQTGNFTYSDMKKIDPLFDNNDTAQDSLVSGYGYTAYAGE